MDDMFGSLMRPFPALRSMPREGWIPALDVYEKDGEMVIRLDLPGIEKKDLKVKVQDDVLTIEGDRKLEQKIEEENYLCEIANAYLDLEHCGTARRPLSTDPRARRARIPPCDVPR